MSRREALVAGAITIAGLTIADLLLLESRARAAVSWNHPFTSQGTIHEPHETAGGYVGHRGVDYSPPGLGTPVYTVAPGTVVFAGWEYRTRLGNTVVVQHADGYHSCYAHLQNLAVTSGQVLGSSGAIGTLGNTTTNPGGYPPHLHLEIWTTSNREASHVDPAPLVQNAPLAGVVVTPPSTSQGDSMTDVIYYAQTSLGPNYTSGSISVIQESMWYQECPGAPLFPLSQNLAYHLPANAGGLEYQAFASTRSTTSAMRLACSPAQIGALIALRGTTTRPIGNFV